MAICSFPTCDRAGLEPAPGRLVRASADMRSPRVQETSPPLCADRLGQLRVGGLVSAIPTEYERCRPIAVRLGYSSRRRARHGSVRVLAKWGHPLTCTCHTSVFAYNPARTVLRDRQGHALRSPEWIRESSHERQGISDRCQVNSRTPCRSSAGRPQRQFL